MAGFKEFLTSASAQKNAIANYVNCTLYFCNHSDQFITPTHVLLILELIIYTISFL